MTSLRIALVLTSLAACGGGLGLADGQARAEATAAAIDSLAPADSTGADSLPAVGKAPADSFWAILLLRVSTLDSVRARHAEMLADSVSAFACVRASRQGFWYELLAGPWPGRTEAIEAMPTLAGFDWARQPLLVSGPRADLLLGVVAEPPAPARPDSAAPANADTLTAAAADSGTSLAAPDSSRAAD